MRLPKHPPVDAERFTELWNKGTLVRVISEELGISADRCDAVRRSLGLQKRESWHGSKTGKRTAYIPSRAEIRRKCLEIQSKWSDEERARRRIGGGSGPVEAMVVPDTFFGEFFRAETTLGGFDFPASVESDLD